MPNHMRDVEPTRNNMRDKLPLRSAHEPEELCSRDPLSGPMPNLVRRNHFHAATDGIDRSHPREIDYSRLGLASKKCSNPDVR